MPANVAEERPSDGPTGAPVLVVGSGLHVAAGEHAMAWPDLLRAAFKAQGVPKTFSEAIALGWESFLVDPSINRTKKAAAKAEHTALQNLAIFLDGRYPSPRTTPIHARLRAGKIADLIVFNFDRSLHHADTPHAGWSSARQGPPLGGSRVWHPHGHTAAPNGIVFGTRRYGLEIASLEAAREHYWYEKRALEERSERDPAPTHWLHALLARREVHLIGLGLRPEEWTLWWALNQRARRFARTPKSKRPRTVAHVFASDREPLERHDAWRSEALRALEIQERRFGESHSERTWNEVINRCSRVSAGRRTP
jgi:hypothetical protein